MTVPTPPLPWHDTLPRPQRERAGRAFAAAVAATLGHRHGVARQLDEAKGEMEPLQRAGADFYQLPSHHQRRILSTYAALLGDGC